MLLDCRLSPPPGAGEGLSAYLKEPPTRTKVNQVFLANTLRTVAYGVSDQTGKPNTPVQRPVEYSSQLSDIMSSSTILKLQVLLLLQHSDIRVATSIDNFHPSGACRCLHICLLISTKYQQRLKNGIKHIRRDTLLPRNAVLMNRFSLQKTGSQYGKMMIITGSQPGHIVAHQDKGNIDAGQKTVIDHRTIHEIGRMHETLMESMRTAGVSTDWLLLRHPTALESLCNR